MPSIHDATIITSPDGGKHWCNPFTYAYRSGGPGCDSTNWDANGDPPICGSTASNIPCSDPQYTDSSHSAMMWKAMLGESWDWINYGFRDGQTPPTGVNDGCDPATYVCFFRAVTGEVARVPIAGILDISAWEYFTCPSITVTYRCS